MIKKKRSTKTIEIDLTGPQGNAFVLLGYAKRLGEQLGWDEKKNKEIRDEMTSGDYENLIRVFDREFGLFVTLFR